MLTRFWKMHGLGNDFVILRSASDVPVAAIADRRRGVGCDQVIVLGPDDRVAFYNPDGSRAGACGNGTRCVADLLMRERAVRDVVIHTDAGALPAWREQDGRITVDMGPVRTGWAEVPLAQACDTAHVPVSSGPLQDGVACSIGNPHVTFFVADADATDLTFAQALEAHPMFPERVNVGVASVSAKGIRLRVWERGAGLTSACGSGACAAAVAAVRRNFHDPSVTVSLDGGEVDVLWRDDAHVLQTGPAVLSFEGALDL